MKSSGGEFERIHAGVNYPAAIPIKRRWAVGVGDFPDITVPAIKQQVVQQESEFLFREMVHGWFRG